MGWVRICSPSAIALLVGVSRVVRQWPGIRVVICLTKKALESRTRPKMSSGLSTDIASYVCARWCRYDSMGSCPSCSTHGDVRFVPRPYKWTCFTLFHLAITIYTHRSIYLIIFFPPPSPFLPSEGAGCSTTSTTHRPLRPLRMRRPRRLP